jgi:predicted esterase
MRIFALVVAVALAACGGDDGGDDNVTPTPCTTNAECDNGQVCAANRCVAQGSVELGGTCSANRDCATGLFCSPNGVCAPSGTGQLGDPCTSGAECAKDLRCELYGLGGTCVAPGTGDLGDACEATGDCIAGLACGEGGTCVRAADAYPPFTGVVCPTDAPPFRIHFVVNRPGVVRSDFYALPFPNDARVRADGTLDLDDFPRPGASILGVDLVDLYADALSEDFDGFSSVANIAFRFSKEFDFDTVGDNGANVHIIDVTPNAPEFGSDRGRQFSYSTGKGLYACQHILQLATYRHDPMLPGHTYAAYVSSAIRSSAGEAPVLDDDLAAVLADAQPSDPVLADVWTKYAPFRTYLASAGLTSSDVAGVTVFTVQDTTDKMEKLAQAVEALAVPALSDLTLCDGSTPSPCEIAGDTERVCGDSSGAFWEIHGRVSIPNFQQGTLPYDVPPMGGAISYDANGNPVQNGTLDVCFALTVPKTTAPGAGWPLVVHAHGTGGSFKAAVQSGIAQELATASTPMATLTFDGVGHGERRGASTRDPDGLVFNIVNPRAARDNHLQGAVDVIQALRVAQVAPFTVGALAIDFDAAHVFYFGHSQGSNVGIPAIATTDLAPAVIFSGAGSYLSEGILSKTSPVDAKAGLSALLGETLSNAHPVMTIWQTFFDRIDPLNYDPLILIRPPAGVATKHVYMPWGMGDTYSPEGTMNITARAMRLQVAEPVVTTVMGLQTVARPVSNNRTAADGQRTAVMAQYAPGAYDGHFVSTQNDSAVTDWVAFLVSAMTGAPVLP